MTDAFSQVATEALASLMRKSVLEAQKDLQTVDYPLFSTRRGDSRSSKSCWVPLAPLTPFTSPAIMATPVDLAAKELYGGAIIVNLPNNLIDASYVQHFAGAYSATHKD